MRRYKWRQQDGWSKDVGLIRLMTAATQRVVMGRGPFTLTQDGEALGEPTTRAQVLDRFRRAISHREIGAVFRIRQDNGKVAFTARALRIYSGDDTTSGNDNCDTYWNWVVQNFKAYNPRYAGAYVCKEDSQHRYGNAIDIFFDTMEQQDRVAAATVANVGPLDVYHVISRNRIWTKGVGWHAYYGTPHYHIHVDFDPQYSGDCGVRG